jgi:renal tumor antigen
LIEFSIIIQFSDETIAIERTVRFSQFGQTRKFWGMLDQPYRVIRKIGEGSFSEVFQIQLLGSPDECYAVKRLRASYSSLSEAESLPEIRYLRALQDCRQIIKLYDVTHDPRTSTVTLILELFDCNLYEFLKSNGTPLSERLTLLLVYQLLQALEAMHSRGLFHRDVKPENCMVNRSTFELKLADLGSTRELTDNRPYTEYVSTRWYRAPECILTSGDYGMEVDLWAVGCIIYECLTLKPLFPGRHENDQIKRINDVVGAPSQKLIDRFKCHPNPAFSLKFPNHNAKDLTDRLPGVSPLTVDLIKRLLTYDANLRLTTEEALQHPAFEILRAYDEMWHRYGCIGPYSRFVLVFPLPPPSPDCAPIAEEIEQQSERFRMESLRAFQERPEPEKKIEKKLAIEDAKLLGARLRAAKRAGEYNKGLNSNKVTKANPHLAIRLGVPSIVRKQGAPRASHAPIVQPVLRNAPLPALA